MHIAVCLKTHPFIERFPTDGNFINRRGNFQNNSFSPLVQEFQGFLPVFSISHGGQDAEMFDIDKLLGFPA